MTLTGSSLEHTSYLIHSWSITSALHIIIFVFIDDALPCGVFFICQINNYFNLLSKPQLVRLEVGLSLEDSQLLVATKKSDFRYLVDSRRFVLTKCFYSDQLCPQGRSNVK